MGGPGKKKGRPKKVDQQQARPIGQVTPAPRPSNDGMKNIHEQARPPVQQDRGASPMMSQSGSSQMGQNMGNKGRPGMQPRGIMGPGMRPRGSAPQQYQQGYPGQPMDIGLLGKKL